MLKQAFWQLLLSFDLILTLVLVPFTSANAQVVLPPVASNGVFPNCATLPATVNVKIVDFLNDTWPGINLNQVVTVSMEDYVLGVVMAELGPVIPGTTTAWDDEAIRAMAIAARTFGSYWCHKHSEPGYAGVLWNNTTDQAYRPYYTGFPAADKTRYMNLISTDPGLYIAYSDPSARYRDVLIDAQHKAQTGNPTLSGWSPSGYAHLPSVNNPISTSARDIGLDQTRMQDWAIGGTGTSVWWQFLAHYYPETQIMNVQPTFTANYYSFNGSVSCGTTPLVAPTTTNNLNYDWGTGSPVAGVPTDNFCVYWQANGVTFVNGWYTFYIAADDGAQLLIDGASVLNKWFDQSSTLYSVSVPMTAGNHNIEFRYYEHGGGAVARLFWRRFVGLVGTYYDTQISSTGTPGDPIIMQRPDPTVHFDWSIGTGNTAATPLDTRDSGYPRIFADTFSVIWRGNLYIPSCRNVTFTTLSDDGLRLILNVYGVDHLLIDHWNDHSPTTDTYTYYNLCQGTHAVEMRYYQHLQRAAVGVTWN